MSGYVCVMDRAGATVDPALLEHLAGPLHFYGNSLSQLCKGSIGIAVRHRTGNGPATRDSAVVMEHPSGVLGALIGNINGVGETGDHARNKSPLRPGPIALAEAISAFSREGIGFLVNTAGSFVFVAAHPGQTAMSVARDHLGDLKLYYYISPRWFVAASEPSSILRHKEVADDIDEQSVARFLGFRFSQTENSFFSRIKEVPAAYCLNVTATDSSLEQYWRFRVHSGARRKTKERVRADFLDQMHQSMANQSARMHSSRMAVSLSGGLDSTVVAALAPRETALCSWFFDEVRDCDERRNINMVADHLGEPVHWVAGDDLYPLCENYIERFVHESSPHINAFAALKHRLYREARQLGCEHVLVGDGGDLLYAARDYWLRDVLLHGGPGKFKSLGATLHGVLQGDRYQRLAIRRLLPVRHIRAACGLVRIPWLTRAAHAALPRNRLSPVLPRGAAGYRFDPAVGAKSTESESEERRLFAQCGVERGNPFWYWPLLEQTLSLPAWWFYHNGRTKILTREATARLLPEAVRSSRRIGLLGNLFLLGIEKNRGTIRDTVFVNPRSDWQRYVKKTWLEPYLSGANRIAFGHTILWRVISYELWYRRLIQ